MQQFTIDLRDLSDAAEQAAIDLVRTEFAAGRLADMQRAAEERRAMDLMAAAAMPRHAAVVALLVAGFKDGASRIQTATTASGIHDALRYAHREIRGARFSGDCDPSLVDRAEEALWVFRDALVAPAPSAEAAPCG